MLAAMHVGTDMRQIESNQQILIMECCISQHAAHVLHAIMPSSFTNAIYAYMAYVYEIYDDNSYDSTAEYE
jgi:hypothetical protein